MCVSVCVCFSLSSTFVCAKGRGQREKKYWSCSDTLNETRWLKCVCVCVSLPPKRALSFHVSLDRQLQPSDRPATTTDKPASEKEKSRITGREHQTK